MKKVTSTFARVGIITGLTLGAFAISVAANWTPPTSSAPTCPSGSAGCDVPLNVGPSAQSKLGEFILRAFTFNSAGALGSVTAGHVLTAIDNNGTVGWRAAGSNASVSLFNSGMPISLEATSVGWSTTTLAVSSDNVKACFITEVRHFNTDEGNNMSCKIAPPAVTGVAGKWELAGKGGTNENTYCSAMCIK